jgi:hypothetical protein
MAKTKTSDGALEMFAAKGAVKIYQALLSKTQAKLGDKNAFEDPKQTCVHLNAGQDGVAFAGVHPRRGAVLLNIRVDSPIKSKRMRKVEQISKNRFDCEMLLSSEKDVDAEVLSWLQQAYELAAGR